jgi:gamma-glutamyltranspeptidase / glutathione hydrolase
MANMVRSSLLAPLALVLLASLPLDVQSSDGPRFKRYAVAADHTQASAAGVKLLAEGGNAADAAAAAMLALGVASPTGSGLGGGGFALYYRASDRTLTFLDFRETAPSSAKADMFRAREGESNDASSGRSRSGGLSVAVPGEPMGIAELVKRFGKRPLSDVVAPAAELAERGFTVTDHTLAMIGRAGAAFASDPLLGSVFSAEAREKRTATNPELGKTLRRFGKEGPSLFYTGAVSRALVTAVKAHGGILAPRDLASYRVVTREPLRATRLGFEWATAPLPSAGGYTIVESLGLLERWLPTPEHWRGSERLHALVESWKGSYLDRQAYFGDPDQVKVPLDALRDDGRRTERANRYHPALALPSDAYALPLPNTPPIAKQPDNRGTSHLCVVDEEGNVASVTTTVNLVLGAGFSAAGLWLNDEMDDFAREVGKTNAFGLVGGAPNLPAPGKRPISSMSPTIVLRDGAPVLCIGGSGGSRIPTAVEQVALGVLKDDLHPLAAITAPRVHHQADPEQVDVRGVPEPLVKELQARGHRTRVAPWGAQVQAIHIVQGKERALLAASDPGKNGEPRGE